MLIPIIREGKLIIPEVHLFSEFSSLLSYLAVCNKKWEKFAELLSSRYILDIFGNGIDIGLPEFVGRIFNEENLHLYFKYSVQGQEKFIKY